MKSKVFYVAILAFLSALLAGCATGYQKSGMTGGYGEKKISDSAYWVYFSGNGFARLDRVINFWIYRCAELTLEHNYRYMSLRPGEAEPVSMRKDEGDMLVAPASMKRDSAERGRLVPAVYSTGDEPRMTPMHGGGGGVIVVPGGGSVTAYTSKGTVLMYSAPLPNEVAWALDAQVVHDFLQAYVKANGDAPDPDLPSMFKQSLIAHEQIAVDASKVVLAADESAAPANPAPPAASVAPNQPAPARGPRSTKEIVDKIESFTGAMHSLYHEHKPADGGSKGGTVVVNFNVSANGIVADCRVSSTTFASDDFPKALAAGICRMTFRPEDVTATKVQVPIVVAANKS